VVQPGGLFVAIAVAGVAAFYYSTPCRCRTSNPSSSGRSRPSNSKSARATRFRQLPQFRAQVADLQGRLEGLRAVLPEEKDFGDLLRNLQTLATQSNLTIRLFKPTKS